MNFEASLEKEDGDILGHALPTVIGGPANEAFNIFPANESALKKWEDVLRHISGNYTEFVIFHLQFEYENENKTRPLFFYYRIFVIQVDNRIFLVHYGRIINGDQANLRREKPNIQSIPKFEYKGTQHINLTQVLDNRRVSKIIHSFPSYTSIQNINRKVDIRVNIWHRCKNMGLMNGIELKEMYSNSSLLNAQIEGMIKNPMVRLFSGENLTGESQDFHLGKTRNLAVTYKGCSNVDELANVKSAETFGTCIRLFEDVKCEKMSLAIYGGSSNSLGRINRILKQVKSVGPCVEDEFVHATFIDRNSGTVTKDPNSSSYFPDKVQFGGFEWEKVLSFRRRSDGLRNIYYVLGPKNRIEYILTWFDQIGPAEISNPVNVEETEFYKSLDKEEGDVPCYAIPLEFYGPANKSFNVFPISQSKVDDWRRIFPFISDSNENLYFYTELRFVYGSDLSSRPQFVYYHFSIEIVDRIYYGRFNNL